MTDDELVAVAVHCQGQWLGNLPTIDESDPRELAKAAVRGFRSLTVRQLANAETLPAIETELFATASRSVSQPPVLLAYRGDSGSALTISGGSLAFLPYSGSEYLRVETLANGVHRLQVVGKKRSLDGIEAEASSAFDKGLGDKASGDDRLIVVRTGPSGSMALVISKHRIQEVPLGEQAAKAGTAGARSLVAVPAQFFAEAS